MKLAEKFFQMIRGTAEEADLEVLEEAAVLQDISHMPSRVKCAVLGWRTLDEMLAGGKRWAGRRKAKNAFCHISYML